MPTNKIPEALFCVSYLWFVRVCSEQSEKPKDREAQGDSCSLAIIVSLDPWEPQKRRSRNQNLSQVVEDLVCPLHHPQKQIMRRVPRTDYMERNNERTAAERMQFFDPARVGAT